MKDSPHSTDRYLKTDESGGGVSAEMRSLLRAIGSAQSGPLSTRFFHRFADLVDDSPADAMACLLALMATIGRADRREVDAAIEGLLARYEAKR